MNTLDCHVPVRAVPESSKGCSRISPGGQQPFLFVLGVEASQVCHGGGGDYEQTKQNFLFVLGVVKVVHGSCPEGGSDKMLPPE